VRVLIETYDNGYRRSDRDLGSGGAVEDLGHELAVHDDVVLSFGVREDDDRADLIVAITPSGWLFTCFRDGDFEQLVGDPAAVGETELVLCGLATTTPRRWLVTRADAIDTLSHYVIESSFPSGQIWERP
jgi:hypothetical protein